MIYKKVWFVLSLQLLLGNRMFAQSETAELLDVEYIPDVPYDLVQDRLTCLDMRIPLVYNQKIHAFIDYFVVRDRAYTHNILKKRNLYFPIFEEILARYGLPDELKYLSIVESGLRPDAISRAGAGGLWQFMPATGRSVGLRQNWYIDERMDPVASTHAACKYLKQLYRIFRDWELALAAYNCGPGNVRKAIRRSGYKRRFWQIYRYLPRETRSYLPQFVAMVYVLNYAEEHNFVIEDLEFLPQYDTIHVSQYLHLKTFSKQAGICGNMLQQLNPHIRRGVLPSSSNAFPLRVPADKKPYIVENRSFLYDTASKVGKEKLDKLARTSTAGSVYGKERIIYRVKYGDVLGTIAMRYRVRVSDLRRWNNLRSNMIRVGQRLTIWKSPNYRSQSKNLYGSQTKLKPGAPKAPLVAIKNAKFHKVKNGDTLWDIAQMYENLSIAKLKKLNNLTSSRIKPGQNLIIGVN